MLDWRNWAKLIPSVAAGIGCGIGGAAVGGPAGALVAGSVCFGATWRFSSTLLDGGSPLDALRRAARPVDVLTDAALGVVAGPVGRLLAPLARPIVRFAASQFHRAGAGFANVTRRVASRGRPACATNSFVAGTGVLMADGAVQPIESVEVGDRVWAADPRAGEDGAREVIAVIAGDGAKTLVDLVIDGTVITATDGHPFWVDDQGRWVDAADVRAGDLLLDADGVTVAVDDTTIREVADTQVHNLTVAGLHTYHVLAGENPILTHNCPTNIGSSTPEARRLAARADDLHGALDRMAQTRRTTAVMGTREGVDVLAGGVRDLTPIQRALARPGDLLARLPGEHAEVTALRAAGAAGVTPRGIATTTNICPACRAVLEEAGATITGPRSAWWR